jgi:hypothetical protein
MFGNSFHNYLKVDIVEDTATAFAGNIMAFDQNFGTWFRESGRQLNHLDTDATLAFPSEDTGTHPDFHTFTAMFANDNNLFIKHFEAAFRKMTALGVKASLLVGALPCSAGCAGTRGIKDVVLTPDTEKVVVSTVVAAVSEAQVELAATESAREPQIEKLTTAVEQHNE